MITMFSSLRTASNWRLNETKLLISLQKTLPVQEETNTIENNFPLLKQISADRRKNFENYLAH